MNARPFICMILIAPAGTDTRSSGQHAATVLGLVVLADEQTGA